MASLIALLSMLVLDRPRDPIRRGGNPPPSPHPLTEGKLGEMVKEFKRTMEAYQKEYLEIYKAEREMFYLGKSEAFRLALHEFEVIFQLKDEMGG